VTTLSIGGKTVRRIGTLTPLNDESEYVVIGKPKDGDGDPRIAFTGSYDDAADYAVRNDSPDNYERYEIGEVVKDARVYVTELESADAALARAQKCLPGSHADRPALLSARTRIRGLIAEAEKTS